MKPASAFAAYQAAKRELLPEYADNTLEACEVHSMSWEFLTSDYHHLFFADQTDKYQLFHAESAVFFPALRLYGRRVSAHCLW